ncbi:MAG TPA: hypothetical protein VKR82_14225 [Candidatus Acidoferrales bacterium]|nr:hypothetical protein [Candidatus Acidoferrales bacterium]
MARVGKAREHNAEKGEAGVHFVASELYRRGIVALPTTGNIRGMDLVLVKRKGNKIEFRALEVKTTLSEKPQGFWPLSRPGRAPVHPHFYYAFVRLCHGKVGDSKSKVFEAFIVPSSRVQKERTKPTKNWPGSWYLKDRNKQPRVPANNWNVLWNS